MNLTKEEYTRKLVIKIIFEYICVAFGIFFAFYLSPKIYESMVGDHTGLDYIGEAIAKGFVTEILSIAVIFFCFIAHPIIVLVTGRKAYRLITSKLKRIVCKLIILAPIIILVIFELCIIISNINYNNKYEKGKNAYKVEEEKYKSSEDFYEELKKRSLYSNDSTSILKDRLNADHDCKNYITLYGKMIEQKCYKESTMIGIDDEIYYDDIDSENNVSLSNKKYPVYMYNAILTKPSKEEDLQYAALGRFSSNSNDYGNYKSEFEDYYIECKIMYVDGEIYAIIGLGESYPVSKNCDKIEDSMYNYNYSYNMILTENDGVKTYFEGYYYPDGGIENKGDSYSMRPNNYARLVAHYPIKKVDKIDEETINEIAKELQSTVLKDSIEKHFK